MIRPRALKYVWIFGLHDSDAMGCHRQENADRRNCHLPTRKAVVGVPAGGGGGSAPLPTVGTFTSGHNAARSGPGVSLVTVTRPPASRTQVFGLRVTAAAELEMDLDSETGGRRGRPAGGRPGQAGSLSRGSVSLPRSGHRDGHESRSRPTVESDAMT